MVTVSVSEDGREATIRTGNQDDCEVRLDAEGLSGLIAELAEARALMSPAFSGRFEPGVTPAFDCDNLIWESHPDPTRRGISIGFNHSGLGWLRLRLSRAQAEDLITSIQFSAVELLRLPGFQGLQTLPDGATEEVVASAPDETNLVQLKRVGE